MLKKTISKNSTFVILLLVFCFISTACFSVSSQYGKNTNEKIKFLSKDYSKPEIVGRIESSEISESSGIAASPCQRDVLWTHNDSGDKAFVYALNPKGEKLATFSVTGAENRDWEDMAAFKDAQGGCFLYVGDIGNNERIKSEFKIYRFEEPEVTKEAAGSSKKNPIPTAAAEVIKFIYPDYRHDAETLMVHPKTGDIYVLTKRLTGGAGVYKLSRNFDLTKINRLEKIADIAVPAVPNGLLTGGDISPDGRRVVITDYFSGYEIVLPEKEKNFDEIWRQMPHIVELGEREQGEAVGYSADGKSIFATSEKKNSPLIRVDRK